MTLDGLDLGFKDNVSRLLAACAELGIEMRPFVVLRSPQEQAKLWRQSRTTSEIESAITSLDDGGACWLAHVVRDVGPQVGRWATNALPGQSWHQYGLAVDCYWLSRGKAIWSDKTKVRKVNGYRVYAKEADALGLTNLGKIGDWVHVQSSSAGSPPGSWTEINARMKQRWG
jgi:hypothetical protein